MRLLVNLKFLANSLVRVHFLEVRMSRGKQDGILMLCSNNQFPNFKMALMSLSWQKL